MRKVRPHLGLVAALTGAPAARACGETDLTAAWVAHRLGSEEPITGGTWRPASAYAPDGGVVVLRGAGGPAGARRVTVDVGPLGYLSIAAHGHADALAVGVALDGHDLVGDPGTGSYFAHPDWRTAHRGTRAHPTVAVDDVDQSVMGGPFLWTAHAGVRVHAVDLAAGRVDAEHDGYRRLDPGLVHRRVVEAPADDDALLVVDVLTGDGPGTHRARTTWPLHPDLALDDETGPGVLARRDGAPVLRVLSTASVPATSWRLRGGDPDAGDLGWWSQRLESRRPCWMLGDEVVVGDAGRPAVVATVLLTGSAAGDALDRPRIDVTDGAIRVSWHGSGGVRETALAAPTA